MKILGISAYYHDSAAAIIIDGKLVAAAQEERFSRIKNDASFPTEAIRFCLKFCDLSLEDIDQVAFYDKPLLKFERLLETYYAFAPRGFRSFRKAMPIWLREKLFLKRNIRKGLEEFCQGSHHKKLPLYFPEHHLSHAASAFYPSPFNEAAIVTIDGVGEWSTATISKGFGNRIEQLKTLDFPHSIGLLYSTFTYYLGFEVNKGEYKLMGLAPYGNPNGDRTRQYRQTILENLITVYDDGSIWLDMTYFKFATGSRMSNDQKWVNLFKFRRRKPEHEIENHHCDLALAIQQVTEDIVLKICRTALAETECSTLCLAGGVALNSVANGKLEEQLTLDGLFIQPAAGDAGGAVGAALAVEHITNSRERTTTYPDGMSNALLGPSFSDQEIEQSLSLKNISFNLIGDQEKLIDRVSDLITRGSVVGWFQGRMEFGPRALGSRSILANANQSEMQAKVNLKIKNRESFRPFAPIILEEDLAKYFDVRSPSPYMQRVHKWKPEWCKELPVGYEQLDWRKKLATNRAEFEAVTHVDLSGRIQTVDQSSGLVYSLLLKLKEKTGHGIAINTSFNVNNEPIVSSPEDAINAFLSTEMDALVIGSFIVLKSEQRA